MPQSKERSETKMIETRSINGQPEIRVGENGGKRLHGYASVFDQETVIGGWFREKISRGAFAGALGGQADIRALFNHDPNHVLGRTPDTLSLREDDHGLEYEVTLNEIDPDAMSVAAKVGRGDVTGSSFSFTIKREEWVNPSTPAELALRVIHEFERVDDVGPVTFPAYEQTSVEARSKAASLVAARLPELMPIMGTTLPSIDLLRRQIDLAECEA